MALPSIASFWNGAPLTHLERLCLKSFADVGHDVTLYSYEEYLNVPTGVRLADTRDILPETALKESHSQSGLAPFSDRFRLNMIYQTGAVWVDCDVVALKQLDDLEYVFAKAGRVMGNAILRLPPHSRTLLDLLEFVNSPHPVIPSDWPWKRQLSERILALQSSDGSITLEPHLRAHLPYMTFGPNALTYFLLKNNEAVHAQPAEHYYSIAPVTLRQNYFRPMRVPVTISDDAILLHHVGGKPFRKKFDTMGGIVPPHDYSLIGKLCAKHRITCEGRSSSEDRTANAVLEAV